MEKIIIDLEMCRINQNYYRDKYQWRTEIIQIGAVRLNENLEMMDQFSTYVQPQFGKIDGYIMNLTGIRNGQLDHAPLLETALGRFVNWIGSEECEIYAWSTTDKAQIRKESENKHIQSQALDFLLDKCSWIDYQGSFQTRFQLKNPPSLKHALDLADITLEGRAHDGLDDAYNTARMIIKLEKDPAYQIIAEYKAAKEEPEELTYSMGNLLSEVLLNIA